MVFGFFDSFIAVVCRHRCNSQSFVIALYVEAHLKQFCHFDPPCIDHDELIGDEPAYARQHLTSLDYRLSCNKRYLFSFDVFAHLPARVQHNLLLN